MPKGVISHKQFSAILFIYLFGASVLFIPEAMWAGKDSWLSTLIGSLLGLLVLAGWLKLVRLHPGKSPIQVIIKVLGPVFGYPIGFYLVLIFFVIGALIVQDLIILVETAVLRNTPPSVIRGSFILVAVYACYKGVESIGRLCELIVLPVTLLVLVVPILDAQHFDLSVLQPVLHIHWGGVLTGTLNALVFPFAETLMPMMLYPYTTPDAKAERYYYLAYAGVAILLIKRTLIGLMIFSPALVEHMTLHFYSVFRRVALGQFFDRIEGLFLGLWLFGLLLKMTITLYITALALAQLTGVRRLQNLWLPLAGLTFVLSAIMFPDTMEFSWFSFKVLPFLALPGEALLPFLVLLAHIVKSRLSPGSVDQANQRGKEAAQDPAGIQDGAVHGKDNPP